MKIILIRHADPDYARDSLTPLGFREADYLAKRVATWPVTAIYCSPQGRAQRTMEPSAKALGMEATTCDWLREHSNGSHTKPDGSREASSIAWNLYPDFWQQDPAHFSPEGWTDSTYMKSLPVKSDGHWNAVKAGLDAILASYGYLRDGLVYRIGEGARRDALLVFFCHHGQIGLDAGHLLNISPMQIWHDFWIPPASLTILASDERHDGVASFRCQAIGDISHLKETPEGNLVSSRDRYMDGPFLL